MLYVSRRINRWKFAITDTDDGKTEVKDIQEIIEIMRTHPSLEIKGVERIYGKYVEDFSCNIDIWQDKKNVTVNQTKSLLLQGVDVRTNAGKIVSIRLQRDVGGGSEPIRVNLASICKKVDLCVLVGMPEQRDSHLILVVSDGMSVPTRAFKGYVDYGVKIDVTGVSATRLLDAVYLTPQRDIFDSIDPNNYWRYIIDSPSRIDFYIARWIIERSGKSKSGLSNVKFFDYNAVCKVVDDYYRAQVYDFCARQIAWNTSSISQSAIVSLDKLRSYYTRDIQKKPIRMDKEFDAATKVLRIAGNGETQGLGILYRLWSYFCMHNTEYRDMLTKYLNSVRDWYLNNYINMVN